MPYVKFDSVSSKNAGSVKGFLEYMSKEDQNKGIEKEFWFNDIQQFIPDYKVQNCIDNDQKSIARADYRYYTGSLNFSETELKFLGSNHHDKVKEFTKLVFQAYAENFNKGLNSSDVRWFAKLESNRYYKGTDEEVKNGLKKSGDIKPGINTHLHFVVGRKSYTGKKISPISNHIHTKKGAVLGGFSRSNFKEQVEQSFDNLFSYNRPIEESFQYLNSLSKTELRSARNHAISKVSEKSQSVLRFDLLSDPEKHKKLEVLINYLQYDGSQTKRLILDSGEILKTAKENNYNGNIYKSLLNLNYKLKDGMVPPKKNMTSFILNYAKFVNSPYKELPKDLREDRLYRFSLLVNSRLPKDNKLDVTGIMKYAQSNDYHESTYYGLKSLNKHIASGEDLRGDNTLYVLSYGRKLEVNNKSMEVENQNNSNLNHISEVFTNVSTIDLGNLNVANQGTPYEEENKKRNKNKKNRGPKNKI